MFRGVVLIGLAAISWGTTGSVTTLLATHTPVHPVLIGLTRLWLAALLLAAGAALLTPPLAIDAADRWRAVLAGVAMAVYQASYFGAVLLSGITVAALIAICSAPLVIATLAALFLGERMTMRVVVALAFGVAGTALLIAGPDPSAAATPDSSTGAALALLAGVGYAVYAVAAKACLTRSRPLPVAGVSFTIAAVVLTPALVWIDAPARQLASAWPALLYLGVVATAGAYAAYHVGLRRVPASVAGIVALLEPLTATALGVFAFGERLGAFGGAGAALMFAALAVLLTARASSSPPG